VWSFCVHNHRNAKSGITEVKRMNQTMDRAQSQANGKNVYVLPDGRRVPVLFRLKKLQTTSAKPLALPAASASASSPVAEASTKTTSVQSNVILDAAQPQIVGPSWLRRNTYRSTVIVLLVITAMLLYNNRNKSLDTSTQVVAVTSEVQVDQPKPAEVAPSVTESIQVATQSPVEAPSAIDLNNTSDSQIATAETAADNATDVIESSSDNSSLMLISNKSSNQSNQADPKAELLAPETLAEAPAVAEPATDEEQTTAKPDTNVIVNRYPSSNPATSDASAWQSTEPNEPKATSLPGLDPSALYALRQNHQSKRTSVEGQKQTTTTPSLTSADWQTVQANTASVQLSNPVPAPQQSLIQNSNSSTRGSTSYSNTPTQTRRPYQAVYSVNDFNAQATSLYSEATLPNGQSLAAPQPQRSYQATYPEYQNQYQQAPANPQTTNPASDPYGASLYPSADAGSSLDYSIQR
jgi:hypothetical protein